MSRKIQKIIVLLLLLFWPGVFLLSAYRNSNPSDPVVRVALDLAPIVNGQGNADAAIYDPSGEEPRHIVFLTAKGEPHEWNSYLPHYLSPSSVSDTQLVALVSERIVIVDSQKYNTGNNIISLTRNRMDMDIEIRKAHTGEIIISSTFQGPEPPSFPSYIGPNEDIREILTGGHVAYEDIEGWLAYVTTCGTLEGGSTLVTDVAFSMDGQRLAVAAEDGFVRLWDVSDKSLLRTFEMQGGKASSVAISADGKTLASGVSNGIVISRLSDGVHLHALSMTGYRMGNVSSVIFSPDGEILASIADQSSNLWDVPSGSSLWDDSGLMSISLYNNVPKSLYFFKYELDNYLIISAFSSEAQAVYLGDVDTYYYDKASDESNFHYIDTGQIGAITSLTFSPDGMFIAGGTLDWIGLWRVSDGELIRALDGSAVSLIFSPDGQTLAAGTSFGNVTLWQVSDGTKLDTINAETGAITTLAFSPDGMILAWGTENGTVFLFSVE